MRVYFKIHFADTHDIPMRVLVCKIKAELRKRYILLLVYRTHSFFLFSMKWSGCNV